MDPPPPGTIAPPGVYKISGCTKDSKPLGVRRVGGIIDSRRLGNLPESVRYIENPEEIFSHLLTMDVVFDVLVHRAVVAGGFPVERDYPTVDSIDYLRVLVAAHNILSEKDWDIEMCQGVLIRGTSPKLCNRKLMCVLSNNNMVDMVVWMRERIHIENNRNGVVWVCGIDTDIDHPALTELRLQVPLPLRDFRARLLCMETTPHGHDLLTGEGHVGCNFL